MSTVLTVGTFDLFHSGHVTLLKHCRVYAGREGSVIVGVNTDRFVSTFKKSPVHLLEERRAVVASCRYVDAVLSNDASCLEPLLISAKPDYLVIGADWRPPRDYMGQIGTTADWLKQNGTDLIYVPRLEDSQSSTKIRQAVARG